MSIQLNSSPNSYIQSERPINYIETQRSFQSRIETNSNFIESQRNTKKQRVISYDLGYKTLPSTNGEKLKLQKLIKEKNKQIIEKLNALRTPTRVIEGNNDEIYGKY